MLQRNIFAGIALALVCVLVIIAQQGHLLASTGDLLPTIDAGSGSVESGSGDELNEKEFVPVVSGSGSLEENFPVEVQTETGSLQSGTGSAQEMVIPSKPVLTESSESSSVAMSSSSAEISSESSMESSEGSSLSSDSSLASSEGSSVSAMAERTVEDVLSSIEATLVIDAPFSKNNPVLRIAKNSRIRSSADIEDSLKLTLTASGTDLPVTFTVRPEEDSAYSAHLVTIATPSVFVPGSYHLSVLWNTSREEQRLLQRMIDTFTGGSEEVLLEQDITLGSTTDNVNTPSVSDLLTLVRTGPSATSLLKTETMAITVTPHQTFIGTVTEQIPPGFTVLTSDPPAAIEKTDNGTTITWNRKWEASSPTTLTYTFKTPLTSPLFAQFGPVKALGMAMGGEEIENEKPVVAPNEPLKMENEASQSSSAISSDGGQTSIDDRARDASRMSEEGSSSLSSISSSFEDISSLASSPQVDPSTPLRTGDLHSGVEESFLSRFLASLFSADVLAKDQVSFTEPTRFQLLSLPSSAQSQDLPAGSLTLTPTGGNVFDANAMPSFTLTKEGVTGSDADILDSDGNLQDAKALGKVISVLTSGSDIKSEILQAILSEKKTEIAENLSQDSSTVTLLAGGERRAQDSARTKVEDALTGNEGQAEAASALQDNTAVSQILDAVVTTDVRNAVAENAVREALGELPQSIIPFLTPPSPTAVDAAAATQSLTTEALMQDIVDVVSNDAEARKDVAQALNETMSNQANVNSSDTTHYPLPTTNSSLIRVTLTDKSGRSFSPAYHFQKGSVVLVLEPLREFEPGMYSLEVQITNPITGEVTTQTQDFAWGVLAMNPDKDRYIQGDTAHIAIGVLDDLGEIICDAQLRLVIKAPSGEKQELTSKADTIHTTDTCGQKDSMMISPDYETSFTFAESGTYLLYLEATTRNGIRGMTSSVEVRGSGSAFPVSTSPPAPLPSIPTPAGRGGTDNSDSIEEPSPSPGGSVGGSGEGRGEAKTPNTNSYPFTISRQAATRLYPAGFSPMTITVTFNQDFTGTVTETAPASFVLTKISDGGSVMVSKPVLSADEGSNHDMEQFIQWHGSWTAGQTATFSYLYDAPDKSPDFFLLGPLRLSSASPIIPQ